MAVPSFTGLPSITTDGTPTVGEVAAFDFGTVVNGTIGTCRLFRNGGDYADASAGSIQWTEAGAYKLRVTIAGTAIFLDSAEVIVAAAVVNNTITPPFLYFDEARAPGTNPVEFLYDGSDSSNLATDIVQFEIANGGSTTTESIQQSIENLTVRVTDVLRLGALATGAFSVRGRYKREKDIDGNVVSPPVFSGWSNQLSDTLGAKALPPATTTWDQENRKQFVVLSNDYRDMQGNDGGGGSGITEQVAISTQSRSDERWFEVTLLEQFYAAAQYGEFWAVGICAADDRATGPSFPPSFNGGGAGFDNEVEVGTVLTCYVEPASGAVDGSGAKVKDGVFTAWLGGVLKQTESHDKTSYKIWGAGARNQKLRLNTGQEPFAYPGVIPAGVKRFN